MSPSAQLLTFVSAVLGILGALMLLHGTHAVRQAEAVPGGPTAVAANKRLRTTGVRRAGWQRGGLILLVLGFTCQALTVFVR